MRGRQTASRQTMPVIFESMECRRLFSATISGTAFVDVNLDGVKQTTEAGLSGEKVYIDANNNGALDTGETFATSNASGAYSLSGLAAGKYRLRAVPPAGYRYDWTGPAGFYYDVTVTSTSVVTGKNFGNTTKSIFGFIYNDLNANGTRDTGEGPLAGWKVWIDTNINGRLDAGEPTSTSDSNGIYSFSNQKVGNYQIREAYPSAWRVSSSNGRYYGFKLSADHVFRGDCGNTTHPLFNGAVFRDLDRDGIKDADESALTGVRVYIDLNNDGKWETTEPSKLTTSTGYYGFGTLNFGTTYTVRVVPPAGMSPTKPTGGVFTLTMTSGQIVQNKNFGLV